MASPSVIRTALRTRLLSISGLTVYERWPAGQVETPCAVIDLPSNEVRQTFGRGDFARWPVEVTLFVGGQAGDDEAQQNLDPYLATSSTGGVFGAIATDPTLGGVVSSTIIKGYRDYNPVTVGDVGLVYRSAVFDLDVWSS